VHNDSDRQIGRWSVPAWVPTRERGNQDKRGNQYKSS